MPKGIYKRNATLSEKLWEYVDIRGPDDCWPWKGYFNDSGYGVLVFSGRRRLVHRVSFFIKHGRWPRPCCCHSCDNLPCANPKHLFEGTSKDNVDDCMRKQRHVCFTYKGSGHPRSKLDEEDVLRIRALAATTTQRELAVEYGVARHTISQIVNRVTWAHI